MIKNTKQVYSYSVHIEPSPEGGFWSQVPTLPGCFSQGETLEETIQNTKEAIELYLEDMKEEEIPAEPDLSVNVRIPISI